MIAVNKRVGICTFEDEDKEIFQKKKSRTMRGFYIETTKGKEYISIKNWQRVSTVCLFAS